MSRIYAARDRQGKDALITPLRAAKLMEIDTEVALAWIRSLGIVVDYGDGCELVRWGDVLDAHDERKRQLRRQPSAGPQLIWDDL